MKNKKEVCEIYKIYNNFDDKIYIGQSWDGAEKRFKRHKSDKSGNCSKLFNAFNSHGRENFLVQVLASCLSQEDADFIETHLIIQLNAIENGYNCKTEGKGGKLSEETKRKIGKANSGENNRLFNKTFLEVYGEERSNEIKSKLSKINTGKKLSEETKRKIGEAVSGEKHPFFGKKFSEETKLKMSISNIGRIVSEETKQKISKSSKGRVNSEEMKLKISETLGGKNHPIIGIRNANLDQNTVFKIYKITNSITKKNYFNYTYLEIYEMFNYYKNNGEKKHRKLGSRKLFKSMEKHGKNNFSIEYLASTKCQDCARYMRQSYIDQYNSITNGYNSKSKESDER